MLIRLYILASTYNTNNHTNTNAHVNTHTNANTHTIANTHTNNKGNTKEYTDDWTNRMRKNGNREENSKIITSTVY